MNILQLLFGSSTKQEAPKEKGPKVYTFSVAEICAIGDHYEYKVQAESRKEAFDKLVIYFFGESRYEINRDVESRSCTISQPHKDSFTYSGMPRWFAKRISGHVRNFDTGEDFQKDLEKYCIDRNIKLDKDK